jgi:triosephosphate isomerase (TIM)
MRKKIVAGNWKMNKTLEEAMEFAVGFREKMEGLPADVEVIVAPPALYLANLELVQNRGYDLAAQNCSHHSFGAFTGELSPAMLEAMSIRYCIVGHSERRTYFHEDDSLIAKKIDACLLHHVAPIYCCGERLEERNEKHHFVTVLHQLEHALFHLTPQQMKGVVVAYEPVWAIGTGVTASADQAQEMHEFIRSTLTAHFGAETSSGVRILYGGSVSPSNSAELFACPDVDGGLVGGASLKVNDFIQIIRSASMS